MKILGDIFGLEEHLPLSFAIAVTLIRFFLIASQLELSLALWRVLRPLGAAIGAVGFTLLAVSGMFNVDAIVFDVPREPYWWRPVAACWIVGSFGSYALLWCWRVYRYLWAGKSTDRGAVAPIEAARTVSRREILRPLAGLALTTPFALAGYGTMIGRRRFSVDERDIVIPNLPADLDGFKIVQITDIHCGPFLPLSDLDYVVDMANDCGADLAVVTGDLVTTKQDPLEQCLNRLATLKAGLGVVGCLGNHEIHANAEEFTKSFGATKGIRFLRSESEVLRVGSAELNIFGVDYQRKASPYLVGAERYAREGQTNILLSHNPDVFPKAQELGYDLTISGHTHGGQVTMEIAEQYVNPARFFTPYVYGPYQRDGAALYVSSGIGTVNLPMRIGALPEIALLRLKPS